VIGISFSRFRSTATASREATHTDELMAIHGFMVCLGRLYIGTVSRRLALDKRGDGIFACVLARFPCNAFEP